MSSAPNDFFSSTVNQSLQDLISVDKMRHTKACRDNFFEVDSIMCKSLNTDQLIQYKQDSLLRSSSYKPKTFMEKFNDPETGYKQFSRDLYGETIAGWTTDMAADAVTDGVESIGQLASGDIIEGGKNLISTVAEAAVGSKLKKIPGFKQYLDKDKKKSNGKDKNDGVGVKGDCGKKSKKR